MDTCTQTSVWLVDNSDDEQAATSRRSYHKMSTLGCSTRHLGPVHIFPQQLAGPAMCGINISVHRDFIRYSHHMRMPGWLFALDINLPGAAW